LMSPCGAKADALTSPSLRQRIAKRRNRDGLRIMRFCLASLVQIA
jgi:hypothetical protein